MGALKNVEALRWRIFQVDHLQFIFLEASRSTLVEAAWRAQPHIIPLRVWSRCGRWYKENCAVTREVYSAQGELI